MFGYGTGKSDHRPAGAGRHSLYKNPFEDGTGEAPSHAKGHQARASRGSSGTGGIGSNPFDDEDDRDARSRGERNSRGHGEKVPAVQTSGRAPRGGSDGAAFAPVGKNPFDDDHEERSGQNRKVVNGRHAAGMSMGGGYGASRTPPPARPSANLFGGDSDEEDLSTARRGKSVAPKPTAAAARSRTPPPSFFGREDHEPKGEGGKRRFFPERKPRDISGSEKPSAGSAGRVPAARTSRTSEQGIKASRGELLDYSDGRRKASDPGFGPGSAPPGSRMGGAGYGDDWTEEEQMKMQEMTDTSQTIQRCQQIANETLGIASGTLDTLQKQGEQIQRTHEAAVRVDQELSRGEQLLGSLGPMFGWRWKPKKTKDITGPTYHASEPRSKGAAENRTALGLGKPKPKEGEGRMRTGDDGRSPQGALKAYEDEKDKQDDALGDLSNVVAQLKDMSTTMGQEMERQNGALDHLTVDMEELDNRVKGANERGRRLLRR